MSQVIANLAMSLDGFIADPDGGCDDLFGFYDNGDVELVLATAGRRSTCSSRARRSCVRGSPARAAT